PTTTRPLSQTSARVGATAVQGIRTAEESPRVDSRTLQSRFGMPRELDGASPVRARYPSCNRGFIDAERSVPCACDSPIREAFVRGHQLLFGRAYALTMHRFEHCRERHAIADSVEAFARFIARRH